MGIGIQRKTDLKQWTTENTHLNVVARCRPQKPAAAGRHAEAGLPADATPCPDRAGEGVAEAAGLEETAGDVRGAANAIPGKWPSANIYYFLIDKATTLYNLIS